MEAERTDQEMQRRQKLQMLRSQGIEPYQSRFDRTHSAAQAIALFEQVEQSGGAEARSERVALAGRLVAIRVMGKATFAHLQDFSGRIQLLAKVDKQQRVNDRRPIRRQASRAITSFNFAGSIAKTSADGGCDTSATSIPSRKNI